MIGPGLIDLEVGQYIPKDVPKEYKLLEYYYSSEVGYFKRDYPK